MSASPPLSSIRNIGIIAHIDAGKTTLTERMLFYTHRIHRMGEVHDGAATMDYLPEEQEHGITIVSACTTCVWRNTTINIIDTPGHVDFTIEVERSLRVLDGAVGVFCAVGGVEPQSETVWRQSEAYGVPKLAFINKMDRLGADFFRVVGQIDSTFHVRTVVLTLPVGSGPDFSGVIDLISMERITFLKESQGERMQRVPLDEKEREYAAPWRESLLERVAESDDLLLERYLAGEGISVQDLKNALRRMTVNRRLVPVFAGSALKNIGVQLLLDSICDFLPSPLDVPPQRGEDPTTGKSMHFPVAVDAPFSALVFKVIMEGGRRMVLMRVYSGSVRAGEMVLNATQNSEERMARLFLQHAGDREKIESAGAGQIVAVGGMRGARTGDTLCSPAAPILYEKIAEYQPVISLALEPRNSSEEQKLLDALEKMMAEDPTLFSKRDPETEQIILSGMGELHLEVVIERLKRMYGVDFRSGRPQVVYQETVQGTGRASAEFSRLLGDVPHYGWVEVEARPRHRGTGNDIRLAFDRQGWPDAWISAIVSGVEDGLQGGVVKGYPVQDVVVDVLEARRAEGASEVGFRSAAMQALRRALSEGRPSLLEPIMRLEIRVPEVFVGDVLGLLGSKGARVENMFDVGGQKVVEALTPLRALFGFSTELRSATQGRAGMVLRFDRFDILH